MTNNNKAKNIIITCVVSAVVAVIMTLIFTKCTAGTAKPTSETTATKVTASSSNFPELEVKDENASVYIAEAKRRVKDSSTGFFTDEEVTFLTEKGYDVEAFYITKNASQYNFPLLYKSGESINLWYTTEHDTLEIKTVEGLREYFIGINRVHVLESEEENAIQLGENYSITYDKTEGVVKEWRFGETVEQYEVPKNAEYCGYSKFEGFIFRLKSDVYALQSISNTSNEGKTVCIAHNVKEVIAADFKIGSDPWSNPLFLMEDGTVKGYVSWAGEKDSTPDDITHLVDVPEGGYDK